MFFILKKGTLLLGLIISVSIVFISVFGMCTVSNNRLLPIYSVKNDSKIIALTFDAAWNDKDTQTLIDIMDKYKVKSSIFGVGEWYSRCEASAKLFSENGHELLNHSNSHFHLVDADENEIESEIEKCEKKIVDITGKDAVKLYRGPYGEYNNLLLKKTEKMGYKVIQWSVDSLDWKKLSVNDMVNRVMEKTTNGSILLFHTGVENTPKTLDTVIPMLQKKGYKFVKASELIYKDNYSIDSAGMQISGLKDANLQ